MNEQPSARELLKLRREAQEHGDTKQVELCNRALADDAEALAECARVIADAKARDEP